MEIDFLVRWLAPKIDGVGDYTRHIASSLRNSGVDARLFTSIIQGCEGEVENVQNEVVLRVINQWQPKAIVKALKAVSGLKPDWLCFQYVPQMYGRWGIALQVPNILLELKREFRVKVAVTFHEFISGWGLNPKDLFLAAVTRLQTRRMLSLIDLAITTCSCYKNILSRLAPRSLTVVNIPVGANIEPVDIPLAGLEVFRNKFFPKHAKILALFSKLSPSRNFSLAVRALQRARQQDLDARLHLIGSVESSNPGLFNELIKLAEKLGIRQYITSTGELSSEDISIHLKMADVFIFPQCDGISTRNTTVMAALAHGLPVVSFMPRPGNFDGFNIPACILVDRNNEEGFIQAAVECLKKSDNSFMARQANIDYYYKNFSWRIIAEQYLKVMKA